MSDAELDALRIRMEFLDGAWRAKRDLWKRSANGITESDVRLAVADYIAATEAYQLARWGSVRCRFTVAGLLC